MKENLRKCLKCGRSPASDSDITLHRFPKPGSKNSLRCESWARYCYPNLTWSSRDFQEKLHKDHRMLCNRHFKPSSFVGKKLVRSAVPHEECDEMASANVCELTVESKIPHPLGENRTLNTSSTFETTPGPSQTAQFQSTGTKSQMFKKINTEGTDEKLIILKKKERYLYMKCQKHMQKVYKFQKAMKNIKDAAFMNALVKDESVNKLLESKLSPSFSLLLQGQIKNFKRKCKGRRWNTDTKIIALRLYKRSPTCYKLLRRLVCLPTPSTLKTLLNNFKLDVGINQQVFSVIKKTIKNQTPSDKEYVLMFDEMSIKKNFMYNTKKDLIDGYQDHAEQGRSQQVASHALVFMVAGIRRKVKQPVAYYLSSGSVTGDRLAVLIKQVLKSCIDADINIAATICDMDGVNKRALGILGATAEQPSFTVGGHKIISLFDTPHLLKCFRNNFMKHDIKCATDIASNEKCGIGIAKWSHIGKFYELDNNNPNFVFAPSLRKDHLNPNTKQKMKVKLAAQVLSHTVAAGIFAKIAQGELTTEATTTANILSNMDKLFDSLNAASPDLRRGKPYATNLKKGSLHLEHFKKMKRFFKNLEFIGCRRPPPFLEGWIWTLNGIEELWRSLSRKHENINSLSTRRLQQDPLENLFGCIRGNCGSNTNPTVGQFVAGLKTAILSNLPQISIGNCENDDNDVILDNFKTLLTPATDVCTSMSYNTSDSEVSPIFVLHEDFDEDVVLAGEIQACAYVCGFIIKNSQTQCKECKKAFISEVQQEMHNFIDFKEYNETKRALVYASKDLTMCVEKCATLINNSLKNDGHQLNLKDQITALLKSSIEFEFLNNCLTHKDSNIQYIIKSVFHICVKRFCTLENRKFLEEASASALKRKIDILKHK